VHRYTQEQKEFIGSICEGVTVATILEIFIDKYGVGVTKKSIKGIMYRNNFKNHMQGYETRLKKGHKTWNKGKKGLQLGGEEGWFKKGNLPPSHKPVGSESIIEGVILVKIEEPNTWRKKHHHIWEQAYGQISKGMVLRFKDGDKSNVTIDNLFIVSRRVCTSVVRRGIGNDDPDLNKTMHNVAELELAIKDLEKRKKTKFDH